ncbi:MAG: lipopolysaccharide heptosyltransferase I [Phyllobacteriaceae bacterium]|nr:lipopolysaccharide heptosyltransferase I [Phyllobacteriaceae bacterium]
MKVLLVKTSSMGDVIHTFPAVTEALTARPDLVFDWLVEESFVDVARLHPGVRRVIPVAVRRWRKAVLARETRAEISDVKRALRAESYDLVLDAQGLVKSAWLARFARRPIEGFDGGSVREWPASLVYARAHTVANEAHAIERTRRLFGAVFGYHPDLSRFVTGVERDGAGGDEVFLLHGTTWPTKRWPTEEWIGLARGLAARGLVPVVTHADAEEEVVATAIAAAVPEVVHLPKTKLAVLAARLKAARATVGVDTGLTHLSAAFAVPTVALFSSTVPGLTGPRGRATEIVASRAPCAPCRKKDCPLTPGAARLACHDTMAAERVLAALEELTR